MIDEYIPADAFDVPIIDDPEEQKKAEIEIETELEKTIEEEIVLQSDTDSEN